MKDHASDGYDIFRIDNRYIDQVICPIGTRKETYTIPDERHWSFLMLS